jgi:hypothetical protein
MSDYDGKYTTDSHGNTITRAELAEQKAVEEERAAAKGRREQRAAAAAAAAPTSKTKFKRAPDAEELEAVWLAACTISFSLKP